MPRRRIGQESFGFEGGGEHLSALDNLAGLLDWSVIDATLSGMRPGSEARII